MKHPGNPSTYQTVRRFAVSRLHLPDGNVLKNQVVEEIFNGHITCYTHHDLSYEEPFTEWRGGDFIIPYEDITD